MAFEAKWITKEKPIRHQFPRYRERQYCNSEINGARESGETIPHHCREEMQRKHCCCCRKYGSLWPHVAIHPHMPTDLLPGSPWRIRCNLQNHLHWLVQCLQHLSYYVIIWSETDLSHWCHHTSHMLQSQAGAMALSQLTEKRIGLRGVQIQYQLL